MIIYDIHILTFINYFLTLLDWTLTVEAFGNQYLPICCDVNTFLKAMDHIL